MAAQQHPFVPYDTEYHVMSDDEKRRVLGNEVCWDPTF